MEVEHVNENMIRVVLGTNDLEERGVTVLDLLGNRKQIETFFYNILEEVDDDHSFVKDQTVTFQVVPNNNGLELLITKTPEEGSDEEEAKSQVLQAMSALSDALDDIDILDDDDEEEEEDVSTSNNRDLRESRILVFSFDNFEDFISLSKVLKVDGVNSNLYQYEGRYYLELIAYPDDMITATINDVTALTKEYATLEPVSAQMLEEYGNLVMEQTALELARYYFN